MFIGDVEAITAGTAASHGVRAAADSTVYVLDHAPLQRFLRASPGVYLRLLHHRTGDAGTG